MNRKSLKNITYLFLFFSFAFPKAGIMLAGFPINVSLVLFLFCIIINIDNIISFFYNHKKILSLYLIYAFMIILVCLINLKNKNLLQIFKSLIILLSPLCICFIEKLDIKKVHKILLFSLFIVSFFTIMQFIFGIEKFSIEGITHAYGEDLSTKNIGFGSSNYADAYKMPSTYQNGNSAALFIILSITSLYYFSSLFDYKQRRMTLIICLFGGISLFLSGSRTGAYSLIISLFIVFTLYFIKNIKIIRVKYSSVILFNISILFLLISLLCFSDSNFINQIYDRFILQTLNDSTGGNRLTQISNINTIVSNNATFDMIFRLFFFGLDWRLSLEAEGIYLLVIYYGLITTILLYSFIILLIYKCKEKNYLLMIGPLTILICFIVDSSYFYIPALFNLFLIGAINIKERGGQNE